MRLVVGAIVGLIMSLYFMYQMFPLLNITHANFAPLINATDPVVANSYNLGLGFYNVIPWLPILAVGFLIISYALKRELA